MPSSPRKTRSRSRLVSASYDPDYSPKTSSPAQTPFRENTAMPLVPVMKATSMEAVRGGHPGSEKRARHKMTELQLQMLEGLYRVNTHPSRQAKEEVAKETGMPLKTVLIWFQNRRQDRRRSKAAAAEKAASARAERAKEQRSRKPSAGKPKPPPQKVSSPPRVAVADAPAKQTTPPSLEVHENAQQYSPPAASTVPSDADSSMDVDDSPTSTAPTSVHPHTSAHSRHFPRIARSPSSSLDSSSSDGSPHALWRLIATSPPPPPPFPPPSDASKRRPFGSLHAQQPRQHKPDLEWACANSAWRRKHGRYVYRDEDDSEGESSELESRFRTPDAENTGQPRMEPSKPRVRQRWQQRTATASRSQPTSASGSSEVAVPREYDLLFPPDMVLGASLLLTFKHSAR